jgi:DmsE family decaheme c-type cytochrome
MSFQSGQRFAMGLAVLGLLVVILPGIAMAADQSKPAPAAGGQYAGSDICASCHEEVAKAMDRTPHYRMKFQSAKEAGATGCEACHGPGSAHAEAGGDVTKIISFKTLSSKEANQRCQACHGYGNEHSNFTRTAHASNDVGCVDCHSPHKSKEPRLLVKSQPELCYTCHTEMRAEFSKPYRHRVNQGLVQCTDCHNEHGGYVGKQLRATAAQDQVCFKCHTEKQGPFVYEHLPVKTEGCSACHTPHGSTNPRLLKTSQVNLLCLQCHSLTHNVASTAPIGPSKDQNGRWQACTMCHSAVHGSNTGAYLNKP